MLTPVVKFLSKTNLPEMYPRCCHINVVTEPKVLLRTIITITSTERRLLKVEIVSYL